MAAAKTRVQLSEADHKVICELARKDRYLSQDRLTELATQVGNSNSVITLSCSAHMTSHV